MKNKEKSKYKAPTKHNYILWLVDLVAQKAL